MNRGLSSNFGWQRNVNHVKFTEKCGIHMEKHILVKKMFTNGLNDIPVEDRPAWLTIASTPEMVDSVNVLILADSCVTIEDISE